MSKQRLSDELPDFINKYVPTAVDSAYNHAQASKGETMSLLQEFLPIVSTTGIRLKARWCWTAFRSKVRALRLRHIVSIRVLLICIWILVLRWGERTSLHSHLAKCGWHNWEKWPVGAKPYHLALITDPQLVDPHTYPGRPWPLSWLTEKYTDQYMRRAFWALQEIVGVQGTILLGDLFDGGREWATSNVAVRENNSIGVDNPWSKYGQSYWMQEYRRFSSIFTDQWIHFTSQHPSQQAHRFQDRLFIASLPGNHDLGLGKSIQPEVRRRFQTYFGPSDRLDIVGNHTFISVDAVSLTAKEQMDTMVQGPIGDDSGKSIYGPTEDFLHSLPMLKAAAVESLLQELSPAKPRTLMDQTVLDLNETKSQSTRPFTLSAARVNASDLIRHDIPSIILSHVPFFRDPGTPCGPLRERFPSRISNLDNAFASSAKDDRNAIHIGYGAQYQNVLTRAISNEIVQLIGGDIAHIFSGDDHDYCEILHREFSGKGGGIPEITVKSFSWAMGIRKPGFLLVSLWNPLDAQGRRNGKNGEATIQTSLCLLPDQLGIFITYAKMLVVSAVVVMLNAIGVPRMMERRLRCTKLSRWAQIAGPETSPTLPLYENPKDYEGFQATHSNVDYATRNNQVSSRRGSLIRSLDEFTQVENNSSKVKGRDFGTGRNKYGVAASSSRLITSGMQFPDHELDDFSSGVRNNVLRFDLNFSPLINHSIWRRFRQDFAAISVVVGIWYVWTIWTF